MVPRSCREWTVQSYVLMLLQKLIYCILTSRPPTRHCLLQILFYKKAAPGVPTSKWEERKEAEVYHLRSLTNNILLENLTLFWSFGTKTMASKKSWRNKYIAWMWFSSLQEKWDSGCLVHHTILGYLERHLLRIPSPIFPLPFLPQQINEGHFELNWILKSSFDTVGQFSGNADTEFFFSCSLRRSAYLHNEWVKKKKRLSWAPLSNSPRI
jgi:hypothetical protein